MRYLRLHWRLLLSWLRRVFTCWGCSHAKITVLLPWSCHLVLLSQGLSMLSQSIFPWLASHWLPGVVPDLPRKMNDLINVQTTACIRDFHPRREKNRWEHGTATLAHNGLAEDEKVAAAFCFWYQNGGTQCEAVRQHVQERPKERPMPSKLQDFSARAL